MLATSVIVTPHTFPVTHRWSNPSKTFFLKIKSHVIVVAFGKAARARRRQLAPGTISEPRY